MNDPQAPFPLGETDVRAMVRLLGEVCALRGGYAEKKRRLMDGLCRLIDADAWAWTLACQYEAGKPPVYVGFMNGGFAEEQFPKYLAAVEHPASAEATIPFINEVREHQRQLTRTIEQISGGRYAHFGRENFERFPAAPLWHEAGIGTLMISMHPLDARSASGIGLYRSTDREPFNARESRLAHIVLSEVPWLHAQGWPEDHGAEVPKLAPRARLVLELLLQSHSRKQIAAHLGISENTVAGYVKAIYRQFNVRSHTELLRHFYQGDGGDRG